MPCIPRCGSRSTGGKVGLYAEADVEENWDMEQDRPTTGLLTPDQLKALQKYAEPFAKLLAAAQANIKILAPAIAQAQENWKKFAPALLDFASSLQRLPEKYRDALMALANEGWYLDPDEMAFDEPARIARAYSEGRHQEAEDRLLAHYRARLPGIEDTLIKQFPTRAAILKQVFEAHRQGLFFASVPTLFTQIDGVCLDISKHYFFMKKKGATKNGVAPYVDQIADNALSQAMLAPFLEPHTVLLSEKHRAPGFSKLNRHMVLHGESFDYGTEANSLRAVSLLYYAARALSEFGTKPPATP